MKNMEDKILPKSYGEKPSSPITFPEQDDLCKRLDAFYHTSEVQLKLQPSSFFRGALYAMRHKENPDWMAQVAHSLREILYQFQDYGKWPCALKAYNPTYERERIKKDVNAYYRFFSDIAHHNYETAAMSSLIGGAKDKPVVITTELFENVVLQFGKVLFVVLRRQLDTHEEIDDILAQAPVEYNFGNNLLTDD